MNGHALHHRELDIHFISMDSLNPHEPVEHFSLENQERVRKELHDQLGHLAHDIWATNGHINVYTTGNKVVGKPQYVHFSREVWDKLEHYKTQPYHKPERHEIIEEDDAMNVQNYNDF